MKALRIYSTVILVIILFAFALPTSAECPADDPDCPINPPGSQEVNVDSIAGDLLMGEAFAPGTLKPLEINVVPPAFVEPLPLPTRYQDPSDVTCGVQALGMALEGLGDGAPTSAALLGFLQGSGMMYDFGTGVEELAYAAQSFGYKGSLPFYSASLEDLKGELGEGRPVVVSLGANGEGEPGHFVTVTGVSPDGNWVSYNDPNLGEQVVSAEEFTAQWSLQGNSGVVVRKTVPPEAGDIDYTPWVALAAVIMAIISQTPFWSLRKGIGGRLDIGGGSKRSSSSTYKPQPQPTPSPRPPAPKPSLISPKPQVQSPRPPAPKPSPIPSSVNTLQAQTVAAPVNSEPKGQDSSSFDWENELMLHRTENWQLAQAKEKAASGTGLEGTLKGVPTPNTPTLTATPSPEQSTSPNLTQTPVPITTTTPWGTPLVTQTPEPTEEAPITPEEEAGSQTPSCFWQMPETMPQEGTEAVIAFWATYLRVRDPSLEDRFNPFYVEEPVPWLEPYLASYREKSSFESLSDAAKGLYEPYGGLQNLVELVAEACAFNSCNNPLQEEKNPFSRAGEDNGTMAATLVGTYQDVPQMLFLAKLEPPPSPDAHWNYEPFWLYGLMQQFPRDLQRAKWEYLRMYAGNRDLFEMEGSHEVSTEDVLDKIVKMDGEVYIIGE